MAVSQIKENTIAVCYVLRLFVRTTVAFHKFLQHLCRMWVLIQITDKFSAQTVIISIRSLEGNAPTLVGRCSISKAVGDVVVSRRLQKICKQDMCFLSRKKAKIVLFWAKILPFGFVCALCEVKGLGAHTYPSKNTSKAFVLQV